MGKLQGMPLYLISQVYLMLHLLSISLRQALDNVDLSDVLALYNHDYANVLGRVDAGTLKLSIDNVGLHFCFGYARYKQLAMMSITT